ncbi:MAG: dCTP deaminase [Armatimonadetes bacterium]|nr:dCTP deaminase [Armatimonadota bacterium]
MILCDSEIRAALRHGQIVIEPMPPPERFSTTAVDLTLAGTDFKRWRAPPPGVVTVIDAARPGYFRGAARLLEDVPREGDGSVLVHPGEFLLALTAERVRLPEETRVAARVEGKSSHARVGLAIHITAPTIHAGFSGQITLEVKNHGALPIRLEPGMPICQLIFEMVFGTPSATMQGLFQDQTSVAGGSETS